MKAQIIEVPKEKPDFEPFTLSIDIESIDEARTLWGRFITETQTMPTANVLDAHMRKHNLWIG